MFFNPGNDGFASAVRSQIYVDKTGLLDFTNRVLGTEQRFLCVSRPRRFGKSVAVEMLTAYYSRGCGSQELFQDKKIAESNNYKKELNRHNVIRLDIQWFRSVAEGKGILKQMISYMQGYVIREIREYYPELVKKEDVSLTEVLLRVFFSKKEKFIIIIDEWDCIFREDKENTVMQEQYINFLRGLLKGVVAESFLELVYITGILPIKKYGTQSALNHFDEYTMVTPTPLEEFMGFTQEEVQKLCETCGLDFEEMKYWYDGYVFHKNLHIYNPKSVLEAIRRRRFDNYWTRTETYESLKYYIEMNFDGLRDGVAAMLGGASVKINPRKFQNDMTSFKSKDDVMTLLVHLGYLAYDGITGEVSIPNEEIFGEFENAIEDGGWEEIVFS